MTKDCHPRKFQIEHRHRTQAHSREHGGREHTLRTWAHGTENIDNKPRTLGQRTQSQNMGLWGREDRHRAWWQGRQAENMRAENIENKPRKWGQRT